VVLSETDRRLVGAVQDGLPLVSRPYAAVAAALGMSETEVIERLAALQSSGVIRRMGVVVRHHELGYRANAMVVWDVPDARVETVGRQLGALDCVTLCYRRPRRPPRWPYNLFTMVHGRDRDAVLISVDDMVDALGLAEVPRAVLFSTRRFKQRGARYA
jgi:DNA-binding Lrp family transcriptional regulator